MTQKEMVIRDLMAGCSITPLEALHKYGTMRLGAIIFDLRAEGHQIKTLTAYSGKKHFAKYVLEVKREASGQLVLV